MTNSTVTTRLSGPQAERAAEMAWEGLAVLLTHMRVEIGWQMSLALVSRTLGEMSVASAPGIEGEQIMMMTEMLQVNLRNGVEQRVAEFSPPGGTA